jgi:hypothetical protein
VTVVPRPGDLWSGTPRQPLQPAALRRVGTRVPALLLPGPRAVLAEPDLEEDEDDGSDEPDRQQGGGEDLARRPGYQHGAQYAGDHEHAGRTEGDYAGPRGHCSQAFLKPIRNKWVRLPG